MSIDTIMLCFLLDKEVNKGGPYCMGPALKKLVEEEGGLEEFDPNNMKPGESFFFNKAVSTEGSVSFGIGWTMKKVENMTSGASEDTDLDCAAIAFNENGQVLDYVGYCAGDANGMYCKKMSGGRLFPRNPNSPVSPIQKGALSHSGDELNGNKLNGDAANIAAMVDIDEAVTVRFHMLPPECKCIAFVAFAYKGEMFGNMENLFIRATEDRVTKSQVARFDMKPDNQEGARGMLFAKLMRHNQEGSDFWEMECQGFFLSSRKLDDSVFVAVSNKCFRAQDESPEDSGPSAMKQVAAAGAAAAMAAI